MNTKDALQMNYAAMLQIKLLLYTVVTASLTSTLHITAAIGTWYITIAS